MNNNYSQYLYSPEEWEHEKKKHPPYKYYWQRDTIMLPKSLQFWIENIQICKINAEGSFGSDKVKCEFLVRYYKWWGSYQFYTKTYKPQ